ncbi:MAG: PAS domain S-box protein [Calditrichaeota bacterium]|nr:PAS domain S-box protein [Calditrichota bacterium]MCB9367334.1 PAS domain S-box protein [Calditrichota bacterium]MCB9391300.1 PAS domain S-box protein [Calditrichota bacterium]
MNDTGRSKIQIILTLSLACAFVAAFSIHVLYEMHVRDFSNSLMFSVETQAHLLGAVGKYESESSDREDRERLRDSFLRALKQLSSESGAAIHAEGSRELHLARLEGDSIALLLLRSASLNDTATHYVPWSADRAEPMKRALQGESGVLQGIDCHGVEVLAAYKGLPSLGLGVVEKIDMSEVMAPFYRAALYATFLSLIVVLGGALLISRITRPLIERYRKYSEELELEAADRQRALVDLAASERRFKDIAESSGDWFWEVDHHGVYTYCSERVADVLGYSAEEVIGKTPFEFMPPDEADRIAEIFQHILAERLPIRDLENRNLHELGTEVTVVTNARPFFDEHGNLLGYRGTDRDVTALKRTELSLREKSREIENSRNVLLQIIESIPSRVFWKSADLTYLGCNSRFALDAGRELPKDLLGKSDYEMGWKDQADLYREDDLRVIQSGESKLNIVEPQTTPSGSTIWLQTSKVPLKSAEGVAWGVLGVYDDITQQKEAEAAQKSSEAQLLNAMKMSKSGHWKMDLLTGDFTFSDEFYALYRTSAEEMGGYVMSAQKYAEKFVHPDDMSVVEREAKGAIETKDPNYFRRLEHRAIFADGTEAYVAVRFEVDMDKDGRPIRTYGTNQDITDRKKTENELRVFKTITDMASHGAAIATPDGRVAYVNQALADTFRLSASDLEGRHFTSLTELFEIETLERILGKLLSGESVLAEEVDARRSDGEALPLLISGAMIPDEYGKPRFFTVSVIDISRLKQGELDRKRLEGQLRQSQKMETIGTLAGGIAHDMNNILVPITMYSEILLEDYQKDEQARPGLEQIRNAARRARDLVKRILTFSRHESAEQEVTQVENVVAESLEFLESTIPKTIDLRMNLRAGSSLVKASPVEIQQALLNLVVNAVHATENTRSPQISITLTSEEITGKVCAACGKEFEGGFLTLSVTDNGCGITPEGMARLFEPFYTTKEVGQGTGLGLSVVMGIVKSHYGHITVESVPGSGSVFTIYLPLAEEACALQVSSMEGAANLHSNAQLLLVDDGLAVSGAYATYLKRAGFLVDAVNSAEEALELVTQGVKSYDLIMADYMMPKISGLQLCGKVREAGYDNAFIIMSGNTSNIDANACSCAKVTSIASKPMSLEQLLDHIGLALDRNENNVRK